MCRRIEDRSDWEELAYMPVQNPAGRGQESVWKNGEKLPDRLRAPVGHRFSSFRVRIPIVCQQLSRRAEPILKSN